MANVQMAMIITAGTKYRAILSASCCTGALVAWARATIAAMQAIRVLLQGHAALDDDPQWGKLHLLEGLVPSLRTMRIARDPDCPGCSAAA